MYELSSELLKNKVDLLVDEEQKMVNEMEPVCLNSAFTQLDFCKLII